MEDLSQEPPTDINPYEVLQLQSTASLDEVKSAYKKLALRHHPDKVAESIRDSAHIKFQEVAFAYAILSDPRRRQRYDATGNTSESITDEEGFNWSEFYKARFADSVTGEKLNKFKDSYQHSEQEHRDVLAAYTSAKGNMDKVFDKVMLSNPLYDEDRFRLMIEDGLKDGEVETFPAFNQEPDSKKRKRQRRAAEESTEAMEYAKELGVYDALFPSEAKTSHSGQNGYAEPRRSKKHQAKQDESDLAALIQKKSSSRADDLLSHLEAKYVGKGKKRKSEEPPEELFQRNRQKRKTMPEAEVEEEDEDEEEVDDLGTEDSESESEEEEDEDEEEQVNRSKSSSRLTGGKRGGKAGFVETNATKKAAVNKATTKKASAGKRRGLS